LSRLTPYAEEIIGDHHCGFWRNSSITNHMRSALFWVLTQHRVVILYQHFGTMYRSHLQGSRSLLGLLDPWRWDRYIVPKRQ
jgi:hypothetical protein